MDQVTHDHHESGSSFSSSPSQYYTPMSHRAQSPAEESAPPYPAPQATPAPGSPYPQQNMLHTRPLPARLPSPQPAQNPYMRRIDPYAFPIPHPAAPYPQQNLLHTRPLSPTPHLPRWQAHAPFAPPGPIAPPLPHHPLPPYYPAPALYVHDNQLRALRTDISVLRGHAARNEQRLMELQARYEGMQGMEGRLGGLVRDVGALVEDVGERVEELRGEVRGWNRQREEEREREMDRERETNGERKRKREEEDEEPDRWLIPFVRDSRQREWEEIWEREDREEEQRTRRGRTWEQVWEMEDEEEGERMRARAMERL